MGEKTGAPNPATGTYRKARRYELSRIPSQNKAFPVLVRQKSSSSLPSQAELSDRTNYVSPVLCERFHLTQREREVVELLIQGLTNKEIAGRINISPNTVRAFVRMIMVKLGVSTRSGIVGLVFRTLAGRSPSVSSDWD